MSELDELAGKYSAIAARYGDNVSGKTAIVTGSNTGLGYEVAKLLLVSGCEVIIATRNPEKGETAVKELQQFAESYGKHTPVTFIHCDLASLRSVKEFTEEFRQQKSRLHILVCNAAAWMVPDELSPTEDGFEYQAASTYFGHVYMVELLKHLLVKSAPSRLIWTVSAAESTGFVDWDDIAMARRTSSFRTYGTAKLYGQMTTRVYAAQLEQYR